MSVLTYFASDYPLAPRENPHDHFLSVNEALAAGITDIPDILLDSGFDRDRPGVILVSDRKVVYDIDRGEIRDGGLDDDFSIRVEQSFEDLYSEKKHTASLEWAYYTEGRAKMVIDYLSCHLKQADEVEMWQIWMGIDSKPLIRSRSLSIQELTPADIKELVGRKVWSDTATEYEIPIQYRLVITRN